MSHEDGCLLLGCCSPRTGVAGGELKERRARPEVGAEWPVNKRNRGFKKTRRCQATPVTCDSCATAPRWRAPSPRKGAQPPAAPAAGAPPVRSAETQAGRYAGMPRAPVSLAPPPPAFGARGLNTAPRARRRGTRARTRCRRRRRRRRARPRAPRVTPACRGAGAARCFGP